jgi:hypothetical protein
MVKVDEQEVVQAILEFREGKLTVSQMEKRLMELGIEYPHTVMVQWELI